MRKVLICAILLGMIISMCGCNDEDSSSKKPKEDVSSSMGKEIDDSGFLDPNAKATTVTTTVTTTTTVATSDEPDVTTKEIKFTEKKYSADNRFSLCYYCSSMNPKVGEPFKLIVKFKNETNETYKVGLENIKEPVNINIMKQGTVWGTEGNDLRPNNTIKPNQEFIQTIDTTFKEKGKYDMLIYADFGRELLPNEKLYEVETNVFNPDLAGCIITYYDTLVLDVQ